MVVKYQDFSYPTLQLSSALYAVAKLGIAEKLGFDLECKKKVSDIAKDLGANADYLFRTMHFLAVNGCFIEVPNEEGVFKHNDISLALVDPSIRAETLLINGVCHYRSFETLDETILTGKCQSGKALNSKDVWDFYAKNPDKEVDFARAMTAKTKRLAPILATLGDYSDFDTVCDIGGSQGILISEILSKNPNVKKGINFDLAAVLGNIKSEDRVHPVDHRYSECPGDFFVRVPAADCYILKMILHDWDDNKSKEILNTIGKSMNNNGRVHIIELIRDNQNPIDEKYLASMDLYMLQLFGAKERSLKQWEELLKDTPFVIDHVKNSAIPHGPNIIVLRKK
ncbi:O-methyltransferase family 2 protein [Heterostelium album PN500]|uniref:O-methyltransferase family 2 protein n=1 Tax=Heterostelium pallidum (strain ATCC 26659 / Pp 5 / PN500) TaxID=670386 RepID=D3BBB9_HETP5|nr:O-methyltransferase family 2 protein [Heterostelium album PN500]EFA81326.1 O-methyltransferase family 2 protein [Heterostelium album PN500]|eukprot:XP_020433444.1 O-methyltransferase family 2 protein [Heterostelium album PN500]